MQRRERAFPGIAIDCELALVDRVDGARLPSSVATGADDTAHCVAMWSSTVHSYDVHVECKAQLPLFFVGLGQNAQRPSFRVEPPVKRDLDRDKPGAGRSVVRFQVSAAIQSGRTGSVGQADLDANDRVEGILEEGKAPAAPLPAEPAYMGAATLRCTLE